jgi:hypothetical protein
MEIRSIKASPQLTINFPTAAPTAPSILSVVGEDASEGLRLLMSNTLFPFEADPIRPNHDFIQPQRSLVDFQNGPASKQCGEFFSDKMQRKVAYETIAERKFLRRLENSSDVDWYTEQPFKIGYFQGSHEGVYYPDVFIALSDGRCIIAEIQETFSFDDEGDQSIISRAPITRVHSADAGKFQALIQFSKALGWGVLVTDGQTAVNHLGDYSFDPDSDVVFRRKLKHRGSLRLKSRR